jgi:uncharacterized protein (DUF1810 family)
MADPHSLQRFIDAQAPVIERVRAELRAGAKTSHWMWFVFPQVVGLGQSPMARRFAIASRDEAAAYLAHEVLGPRLTNCTRLVLAVQSRSAREIFGAVDEVKFRSSMTLFDAVAEGEAVFGQALDQFFAGARDPLTLERL